MNNFENLPKKTSQLSSAKQRLLWLVIGCVLMAACSQNVNHDTHGDGFGVQENQSVHSEQGIDATYAQKLQALSLDLDQSLDKITPDQPVDQWFVDTITAHHRATVAMAYLELRFGSEPSMRELAQSVIDMRQADIEWMSKKDQSPPMNAAKAQQCIDMEQIHAYTRTHLANIQTVRTADADLAFASVMMVHQQWVDAVINEVMHCVKDGELQALAMQIISDQQSERASIKQWHSTRHKTQSQSKK